ncbi:Disease resistance protein [Quillaja saponaria]|uniref:Disease resistance protein n=1 Tax=Quillaja saponaria TaxID=32244 RepID=A0AAD7L5A1_QUISA|nr:Disease resistance protein [Quillaja saponaria]
MEFGGILDIITRLWDCSSNRIDYIRNLEDNLSTLQTVRNELRSVYEDVNTEIELAEEQQSKRTNEYSRTTYKIGKILPSKIDEVRALIDRRHAFNVVAHTLPGAHATVELLPLEMTVGLESALDKFCKCFEEVGIIGLYGMGGVGKTTLLKKFNNDYLAKERHDFNMVIWVVVSQDADVMKVQDVIWNKLHAKDDMWLHQNVDERAISLFNLLRNKKFVLMLDDIWERIDLLKVGVPIPNARNGSKVIFTTRSEEVCGNMESHRRMRVECLAPEKALELFQEKVGEETINSHHNIAQFAKVIAAECKGLPLALITVGRSMANKKNPHEWKRAIKVLQSYPSKFAGMIDYVYLLLEFSYENLPSDTHKVCFLYCSLFPEDHKIRKDELIELWIGEGDMALWVAGDHGLKPKFVVNDGICSLEAYYNNLAKWKEAEKISLWHSTFPNLLGEPFCPKLFTIIVRDTRIERFPNSFFANAQAIRVLDLSHNSGLRELPAGICELVNLQYLDLSYTSLKMLPIEFKNLTSLKYLMLNFSFVLTIPSSVLLSLLSLQLFGKLMVRDEIGLAQHYNESSFLQELEFLPHLKDISIVLFRVSSIQILLNSTKLHNCVKYLWLHIPNDFKLTGSGYLCNLRTLKVTYCGINHNLTWFVRAPNLQRLEIVGCDSLEEVIGEDFGVGEIDQVDWNVFENLETLELRALPRLRSICSRSLAFPCLKKIKVTYCPTLLKLPFDSSSANNSLESLTGELDWWNSLHWEDQSAKDIFSSKFQSID